MTGTFDNHCPSPLTCCCAPQTPRPLPILSMSRLKVRSYIRKHLLARRAMDLRRRHQGHIKEPNKGKKSVKFSIANHVVPIEKTAEEIQDSWYHPTDYNDFEVSRFQSIAAIVRVQGDLSKLNSSEHSLIGLEEQLTRKQILNRRLKTVHYRRLVLERFYRKCQGGSAVHDPAKDHLLALSEMLMRHSSQRAQWRALFGREECELDSKSSLSPS